MDKPLIPKNKSKRTKPTLYVEVNDNKRITTVRNFCVLPPRSRWNDYYIHTYGHKELQSIPEVVSKRCRQRNGEYLVCSYRATMIKIDGIKHTIIDKIEYTVMEAPEFNTYGFFPFQRIIMYERMKGSSRLKLILPPNE